MPVLLVLREAGEMEMTKEERLEKLLQLLADYPGGRKDVCTIGEFTYGTPTVRKYDEKTRLTIGKFCSIADNVQIVLGGEHHTEYLTTYPFDILIEGKEPKSKGDVVIGNDVWIGKNVTILSGVTIGDGAVIGAGSVVVSDVERWEIVGGAPAEHIRYRWQGCKIDDLNWWDWPLENIAEAIPMLQAKEADDLIAYWKEVVIHE